MCALNVLLPMPDTALVLRGWSWEVPFLALLPSLSSDAAEKLWFFWNSCKLAQSDWANP